MLFDVDISVQKRNRDLIYVTSKISIVDYHRNEGITFLNPLKTHGPLRKRLRASQTRVGGHFMSEFQVQMVGSFRTML